MKTLEEKAYSHVDKIFSEIIDKYKTAPWNEFRDALAQIYLKGAAEALARQWRSVEEELPEEYTMVLCRMKSNDAIVSGFITKRWHDYPEVSTSSDFHFEDYEGYECTHWMPIPEPPKDENE